MPPSKLTIFELVNEKRKEIFVAATALPIFAVARALREARPPEIAAWNEADVTALRSIEFGLTRDEADAFIDRYVRSRLPPGWSFLRERGQR